MKIILVEDSPANLADLKKGLAEECPQVTIVGETSEVNQAIALIEQLAPDLVLLDVGIRGGTGFDVLNYFAQRQKIDFEAVFMTGEGIAERAIRAWKAEALDFLVKPIDPQELKRVIEKVTKIRRNKQEQRDKQAYIDKINRVIEELKEKRTHLSLKMGGGDMEWIEKRDIQHLEAAKDATIFHVWDNDRRQIVQKIGRERLGEYEALLAHDSNFLRVHDSYLINLQHLARFNYREGEIHFRHSKKPLLAATRLKTMIKTYLEQRPK